MLRHGIMTRSDHNGLCELHEQVFHFIQGLKHGWVRLFINNLYILRTLAGMYYKYKALINRVTRTHQCGGTKQVVHKESNSKNV